MNESKSLQRVILWTNYPLRLCGDCFISSGIHFVLRDHQEDAQSCQGDMLRQIYPDPGVRGYLERQRLFEGHPGSGVVDEHLVDVRLG